MSKNKPKGLFSLLTNYLKSIDWYKQNPYTMPKQFKENLVIVFFIGPSCSGKTSLARLATAGSVVRLRLSADQIRGSLQHYDVSNENHQRLRNHYFETTLEVFFQNAGFDIFCEVPRSMLSMLSALIYRAQNNYNFSPYLVFLETDQDVLLDRFNERKVKAESTNYKLAVSDTEQFKQNLSEYLEKIEDLKLQEGLEVHPRIFIDTTKTSIEEAVVKINDLIASH